MWQSRSNSNSKLTALHSDWHLGCGIGGVVRALMEGFHICSEVGGS